MLVEKPWIVRHKHGLLISAVFVLIISLSLLFSSVIGFPKISSPYAYFIVFGFMVGIFVSIMLYGLYKSATRFDEILNALKHDIVSAKTAWLLSHTLSCESLRHGRFLLYYFGGSKYSPPYYELRISTSKQLPEREEIFVRKTGVLVRGPREKVSERFKDKLPAEKLMAIKSLKFIETERKGNENRFVARFDDEWLRSETSDIIECLKILREVEEKL